MDRLIRQPHTLHINFGTIKMGFLTKLLALFSITTNDSYDYTMLVTEWKPSDCIVRGCKSGYNGNSFNIHGNWPERNDGSWPSYCSNATFSLSSSTENDLLNYWISDSQSNEDFWKHEWEKHGTCISPAVTCNEFFLDTVTAFKTVNIQGQLEDAGITPSNSISYDIDDIVDAFKYDMEITCSEKSGKKYLYEVVACLDKSGD